MDRLARRRSTKTMKVIEVFYLPGNGIGLVIDCRDPIHIGANITDGKNIWKVLSIDDAWILNGEVKEKSLILKGKGEPRVGAWLEVIS